MCRVLGVSSDKEVTSKITSKLRHLSHSDIRNILKDKDMFEDVVYIFVDDDNPKFSKELYNYLKTIDSMAPDKTDLGGDMALDGHRKVFRETRKADSDPEMIPGPHNRLKESDDYNYNNVDPNDNDGDYYKSRVEKNGDAPIYVAKFPSRLIADSDKESFQKKVSEWKAESNEEPVFVKKTTLKNYHQMAGTIKENQQSCDCKVTIKLDREWGEYIVKQWVNGKVVGTYHTDDKQDALNTKESMMKDKSWQTEDPNVNGLNMRKETEAEHADTDKRYNDRYGN